MSKRERLAERAEDYIVFAGNVAGADGVYANSAFLSGCVFSASAMNKTIGGFFAGSFADILGQRKS